MIRVLPPFLLMIVLLLSCSSEDRVVGQENKDLHLRSVPTAFTTRIAAADPETQAIGITQMVYPATREEHAAGAIIITRQNTAEAFTAMQRVTHMPVNAPLLYLGKDGKLSEAVINEMKRLRPDGVMQDGKVQVYVVGDIDQSIAGTIRRELGYKVRALRAEDPVKLAELLDRWQAALKSDHPDEVLISALDHPQGIAHGIGAMGWNAHMGRGFAWVYKDSVPEETRKILKRRYGSHGAFMYLTGGPEVISDKVARELSEYGQVRRVYGPDIYSSNTVNAGYKDFGRNFGWWTGWKGRDFGWGISEAGHNFIIGSADDLLMMIPAVLLGHMGKHGPLLLVEQNRTPEPVTRYLTSVQPYATGPSETILNHAFIIGDESHVSWQVQKEINMLMRPQAGLKEKPQDGAQRTRSKTR